jgi:hypothetical protein
MARRAGYRHSMMTAKRTGGVTTAMLPATSLFGALQAAHGRTSAHVHAAATQPRGFRERAVGHFRAEAAVGLLARLPTSI